jgi:uncharacterized membrane protein required for colicin V production
MPTLAALTVPDTIVLVVCGLMGLRGALKGFAWQAVRTAALVGAIWGASLWHEPVGAWIDRTFPIPSAWAPWIGWGLVLAVLFLFGAYLAHVARGFIRTVELTHVDRALGLVLGAVVGLVLCTAGFLLYGRFAGSDDLRATFEGSVSRRWMERVVDVVEPVLPPGVRRIWLGAVGEEPPRSP